MILLNSDRYIDWQGLSGKAYEYAIFNITEDSFPNQPGNFIFANEVQEGFFVPFYIDHSIQLKHTISILKSKEAIRKYGLYSIHIHINWSDTDRLIEVKDLIKQWEPACNNILNL